MRLYLPLGSFFFSLFLLASCVPSTPFSNERPLAERRPSDAPSEPSPPEERAEPSEPPTEVPLSPETHAEQNDLPSEPLSEPRPEFLRESKPDDAAFPPELLPEPPPESLSEPFREPPPEPPPFLPPPCERLPLYGSPCLLSRGSCSLQGRSLCSDDGTSLVCISSASELCDGKDNDCDGKIDEDCPSSLHLLASAPRPLGVSFLRPHPSGGFVLGGFLLNGGGLIESGTTSLLVPTSPRPHNQPDRSSWYAARFALPNLAMWWRGGTLSEAPFSHDSAWIRHLFVSPLGEVGLEWSIGSEGQAMIGSFPFPLLPTEEGLVLARLDPQGQLLALYQDPSLFRPVIATDPQGDLYLAGRWFTSPTTLSPKILEKRTQGPGGAVQWSLTTSQPCFYALQASANAKGEIAVFGYVYATPCQLAGTALVPPQGVKEFSNYVLMTLSPTKQVKGLAWFSTSSTDREATHYPPEVSDLQWTADGELLMSLRVGFPFSLQGLSFPAPSHFKDTRVLRWNASLNLRWIRLFPAESLQLLDDTQGGVWVTASETDQSHRIVSLSPSGEIRRQFSFPSFPHMILLQKQTLGVAGSVGPNGTHTVQVKVGHLTLDPATLVQNASQKFHRFLATYPSP